MDDAGRNVSDLAASVDVDSTSERPKDANINPAPEVSQRNEPLSEIVPESRPKTSPQASDEGIKEVSKEKDVKINIDELAKELNEKQDKLVSEQEEEKVKQENGVRSFLRRQFQKIRGLSIERKPKPVTSRSLIEEGKANQHNRSTTVASSSNNNEPDQIIAGAGFQNFGYTCYLNAVMQCLIHTPSFVDSLYPKIWPCDPHCGEIGAYCLPCDLVKLVSSSVTSKVVSPDALVDYLNEHTDFKRGIKQDASEWLQWLLEKLDLQGNELKNIFSSYIEVLRCGCSSPQPPDYCMRLVQNEDNSLEGLLELMDNNKDRYQEFECHSCQKRGLHFFLSEVAVFQLMYADDGRRMTFPFEVDMGPMTGNQDYSAIYDLYAVIVYRNEHYFCYICISPNKWFRFDDSGVKLATFEEIRTADYPYLLFYRDRKKTRWWSRYSVRDLATKEETKTEVPEVEDKEKKENVEVRSEGQQKMECIPVSNNACLFFTACIVLACVVFILFWHYKQRKL